MSLKLFLSSKRKLIYRGNSVTKMPIKFCLRRDTNSVYVQKEKKAIVACLRNEIFLSRKRFYSEETEQR